MFQVYLFCLVLAGGLAILSAFGDLADTDAVASDLDAGAGLDGDLEIGADADAEAVDSGFDWAKVLSMRGLLYSVFGFGLAGALQVWLLDEPAGGMATIITSAATGLVLGWSVDRLVDLVQGVSTPDREGDVGFEGLAARVLVPIRPKEPGRIRVLRDGRTVDLRALPHGRPDSDPSAWEHVVVVEVRNGHALVVPADDVDLELET